MEENKPCVLNIRLNKELLGKLAALGKEQRRSRSMVARIAIEHYLKTQSSRLSSEPSSES